MMLAQIDSVIVETAKQVPALVVLCYVVWMFLGKLALFIDGFRSMQKEHLEAIEGVMREHIDARTQAREATKENTQAMNQNTAAVSAVVEAVDKLTHERRDGPK